MSVEVMKVPVSIVRLYSVYDRLAGRYGPIYQAITDEVAIRRYYQIMKTVEDNQDDFELVYLGQFDEITGEIVHDFKNMIIPEVKK